jgi:alpha-D-ribose 1-methylphosphonate 5-phosphate C-P lyase
MLTHNKLKTKYTKGNKILIYQVPPTPNPNHFRPPRKVQVAKMEDPLSSGLVLEKAYSCNFQ